MNNLFYTSPSYKYTVNNQFMFYAKVITCLKITDDVFKFKSALKTVFTYGVG